MNIDEKELIEMLAKAHRLGRTNRNDAIDYLYRHADELGLDPKRFAIAGNGTRLCKSLRRGVLSPASADLRLQRIDQEVARLLIAKEKKMLNERKIESGRLDDPQTQEWIEAFKIDSQWQSTTFTSTPSTITNWFWEEWKSSEDRRDRPENEK